MSLSDEEIENQKAIKEIKRLLKIDREPKGWMAFDGSTLAKKDFADLYSAIEKKVATNPVYLRVYSRKMI